MNLALPQMMIIPFNGEFGISLFGTASDTVGFQIGANFINGVTVWLYDIGYLAIPMNYNLHYVVLNTVGTIMII